MEVCSWRVARRIRLYCTNMIDPVLLKVYHTTKFIVYTPHKEVVLTIGERNPALDDLMGGSDSQSGAFITAWNPRSLRLLDAKNQARQTELITEARKRGYVFLMGRGVGQDEGWPPEASIFIMGIPVDAALELGKLFGQLAIVFAERGQARRTAIVPRMRGLPRTCSEMRGIDGPTDKYGMRRMESSAQPLPVISCRQ